jgi:hypothetical protein
VRVLCPLILLGHFLVLQGAGRVLYVAPNGDDGHQGSAGAPFRTLSRAVEAARAGDTVTVGDGTYGPGSALTDGDLADTNHSPVALRNSGSPSAWILIRSQHKWGAVLDCEMRCDSYFDLARASYVEIRDFVITRGYREGIHSNDSAHHITLRGNRIEFIANRETSTVYGLDGMYTNPNCHDFLIDGNVFHDIGRTNVNWLDHGLYLRGWNFTVTNNVFYHLTRGWAITLADGLVNVLIGNNIFAFPNPIKDGHIMMWNRQSGLTIENNIFYAPRNHAIDRFDSSASACIIGHNLVYGASAVMADESGCRVDKNRIGADPRFVNAATPPYDFRMRADSPAIGNYGPSR